MTGKAIRVSIVTLALAVAACGDNLGGNTAPTVGALTLTTDEDTPITHALAVEDGDGDTVTVTLGTPGHGTVTMAGGGITYTPAENYHGSDEFTVTASDGKLSAEATVTVTVTSVNDPPTGVADSFATNEDVAHAAEITALLANDSDVDGDTLTITSVGNPTNGSVSMSGGDVIFTPTANFAGSATYQYIVSDGTVSSPVTVTVTVGGVNDPPVATDDTGLTTDEDVALDIAGSALVTNDTDADGQTLSVSAVANATHGTVALASGMVTFTPEANFSGTATFDYTVTDGAATDTGTVTLMVNAVNDAPVAVGDAATTDEDTAVTVTQATMIANDTDVEGSTLTVTAAGTATNGTVSFSGGDITFTPTANVTGTGSFQYTVSDGTATTTGTVTVTITPVNDAPVAVDDAATTNEDTAVQIAASSLVANDIDIDGDALAVLSVSNVTNGSVSLASGTITFTPAAQFSGSATFDYVVSDGTLTDTGTVTVVVSAVNDAPVATDDAASTDEDTALQLAQGTLVGNDSDADGDTLQIVAVSNVTNGSVALASGIVTFTPSADVSGTAGFDYTVSDGNATDVGHVTVTVNAVNDPPIAADDTAVAEQDVPKSFSTAGFLANDTDIDGGVLSITGLSNASNCSVSLNGGTIDFTPTAGFSGTATFDYTVSDGNGGTDTGTVSITVVVNACGDGVVLGAEQCDDHDTDPGDGCNGSCQIEIGWTCGGQPSTCTPICGDGLVRGAEVCDDNNLADGDGCDSNCTPTGCGNAIKTAGEVCDDGNQTDGDGCDSNCTSTGCGNGIKTAGEACDDGDADNTDGCTTQCTAGVICNATAFATGDAFAVDPVTGNCYVTFESEMTTFAGAEAACVASGGYLATITSSAENTLVTGIQNPTENPWIGAQDDANTTDAVFAWVTGEAFTFTSFDAGEPDDDAGLGGSGDCLHLNPNGAWADTNCNIATFVVGRVCEVELDACHDGVVQPTEECQDVGAGDNCSATCQIEDGCGDGNIDANEQCDDDNTANGDGCSSTCHLESMLFSEYVEGSSNNKALEIKNPLSTPINLLGCSVQVRSNGSPTPSATLTFVSTTVAANDVLVACNNLASPTLLALCDVTSTALTFNGNDAISLVCAGTTLDIIGQVGFDPGIEWGTGNTSTADNTLRRKCAVTTGDTNGADAFDPATEWAGFATDTFTGLGDPTCAP